MRTIDYDEKDKNTGNTETHLAVDEKIRRDQASDGQLAMEEGFAASSGIRPETAESGGRVKDPETGDNAVNGKEPRGIKNENPGLADS